MIAIRNTVSFQLQNCVTDPDGRFIFLLCTINNVPYTLTSIYAPNHHQMHFLKKTLRSARKTQKGHLLVCGDFNLVPNKEMDSTTGSKRHASPLDKFISTNDLFDVWRCCHTSERDYTLSPRHNTYSRIDLFLTDKRLLQKISNSTIHTTTWSDHAPISISISANSPQPNSYIWRVNYLLNNLCYSTPIKQLEEYFLQNISL